MSIVEKTEELNNLAKKLEISMEVARFDSGNVEGFSCKVTKIKSNLYAKRSDFSVEIKNNKGSKKYNATKIPDILWEDLKQKCGIKTHDLGNRKRV